MNPESMEQRLTPPEESGDALVSPATRSVSPAPPPPNASTSSSAIRMAQGHARPPFLASVLLRQRDEQRDPICVPHGRAAAVLGGAVSAGLAFVVGGGMAWGLVAVSATLLVAGLVPLAEPKRAFVLMGLGLSGCVLGLILRASPSGATGLFAVLATSAGLVLRSRRVGSIPARALVALGALLACGWLMATGLTGVTAQSFELAALVGPAVSLSLVITLALVLLAFVDDHGSSGGGWLAILVLLWGLAEALTLSWQSGGLSAPVLGALAASLLAPSAAVGLAQIVGGHPTPRPRPAA